MGQVYCLGDRQETQLAILKMARTTIYTERIIEMENNRLY
jgi:hypothetical protein